MAKPTTINERKAEVIRLRIDLGWEFKAIAAALGCTARWAQYVMERYAITGPTPAPRPAAPGPSFTHRWAIRRMHPERFGHPCRVVSAPAGRWEGWTRLTVEFPDGTQVAAEARAIRKAKPVPKWRATVEGRRGMGGRDEVPAEIAPFMKAALAEVERVLARPESPPGPAICGCGDPQHRDRGGWVHPKTATRSV